MAELPYPLLGAVSTDSSILLASNSSIHLIAPTASSSASTQTYTLPPSTPSAFIRQLAISPDSAFAATVSDDKGLRVYSLAASPITLLSTRYLTKKSSCLSFTQDNNVLVSDKVGDCYLYPLEARAVSAEKLKKLDVQADPTLNPEADYLLGHVSVVTSHILPEPEQDGKRYLITADRDEHIRITRYPDTFVIERYMFGTEGFISSMHIPEGHPELLISGGGEGVLRIWNWKLGKQVGSIDIQGDVLPYRKARSTLRKDKRKGKSGKKATGAEGTEASVEEEGKVKDFYDVPAGWMLPSGMGVLIKEITSLRIADSLVVLFYSEGAAALHSFVFPKDPSTSSSSSPIQSFPTEFPILDYTLLPGSKDDILLTLDTTFGIVTFNQESGQRPKPVLQISEEQKGQMQKSYKIVKVAEDGSFTDITSSHPLGATLQDIITSPSNQGSGETISSLNLYPNLSLYPRWPGLEEDDDLAGPADQAVSNGNTDANANADQASAAAQAKPKKEYTQEEYEAMNLKYLGRLKSQGYKVDEVMRAKRREKKDKAFDAKRRRLDAGQSELSKEEQELTLDEEDEEAGNA